MTTQTFLKGAVELRPGDCLEILKTIPDNSIDAVVSDPPYFLTSIAKRFGGVGAAHAQFGTDGAYARLSGGFMNKMWDSPEAPPIDPEFAHWFAGFVDGEGCFSVHKKTIDDKYESFDCQFSITLRADDKPTLVAIQAALGGIGSLADRPAPKKGNGKRQSRYCISSKADCQKLQAVFDAFPLRAKKARDFEIWSHALNAWVEHEPGDSWADVAYFREKLMAVRNFGSVHRPERLFFYRVGRELLRVLKPGGHLVMFNGTRTYHHMVCGLEDAGFEIRDQLGWCYFSGFPKGHDVSKGIDKHLGADREKVRVDNPRIANMPTANTGAGRPWLDAALERGYHEVAGDDAATPQPAAWQGWNTALKPSWEPICLARKPLIGTVAANVLEHGTGAINVDGCRIGDEVMTVTSGNGALVSDNGSMAGGNSAIVASGHKVGHWPANIIIDGSAEVIAAFGNGAENVSRLYYTAKADKLDRIGSKHPTVKPVDLMQWLIRLITPKGGLVLDPFSGSGSTGEAAWREGMRCILIEREPEYQADIAERLRLADKGPSTRKARAIKQAANDNALPLFGGVDAQPELKGEGRKVYGEYADQAPRKKRNGGGSDGGVMAGKGGFGFRIREQAEKAAS